VGLYTYIYGSTAETMFLPSNRGKSSAEGWRTFRTQRMEEEEEEEERV